MKDLKQYINEKLIVNKNYTVASKVDEIWDILDNESSLSWAGKKYPADEKLDIDDIIKYMIHTYGRFQYIVNDTFALYTKVYQKYTESASKHGFMTEFDKDEFKGAVILNNFAGMGNDRVSKIIAAFSKIDFNDEILITTKHDSKAGNKDFYVLDIYDDGSYLILAINLRDSNRMSLKTMDCMFILKKI